MKLIIVNSAEAFLGEAKVSKEKVEIIGIRIDNVYPTKRDVNEFVQAENKPNEIKTFIYQGSVSSSVQDLEPELERELAVANTIMAEVKKTHLADHQNYKFRKARKFE